MTIHRHGPVRSPSPTSPREPLADRHSKSRGIATGRPGSNIQCSRFDGLIRVTSRDNRLDLRRASLSRAGGESCSAQANRLKMAKQKVDERACNSAGLTNSKAAKVLHSNKGLSIPARFRLDSLETGVGSLCRMAVDFASKRTTRSRSQNCCSCKRMSHSRTRSIHSRHRTTHSRYRMTRSCTRTTHFSTPKLLRQCWYRKITSDHLFFLLFWNRKRGHHSIV